MKRIFALDYGVKRIGVALSDPLGTFAQPMGKIAAGKTPEESAEKVWKELQNMMKAKNIEVELLVVGFPLSLKGAETERAREVRRFSTALEKLSNYTIIHMDERLSSLQAERSLQSASMNRKERASHVDEVAAAILLQCYLDQKRFNNAPNDPFSYDACTQS